jgi:putative addiction module component (TIGR02574 family)
MPKSPFDDALALPLAERIRLAQALWTSIAEAPESFPLTEAERAELDRRLEAYDKDPEAGTSWDEVKARVGGRARA